MDRKTSSTSGSGSGSEEPIRKYVKRRRATGPKVRSGCITCKVRRVKCDEGKPGCQRCYKFGKRCDGYARRRGFENSAYLPPSYPSAHVVVAPDHVATIPVSSIHIVPGLNALIGHHSSSLHDAEIPLARQYAVDILPTPSPGDILSPISQPLYRSPSRDLFSDNDERIYFQRYCEETAAQLTGCLESDLWSRIVLQASEADSCIRHAVTALGALNLKAGWKNANPRFEQKRLEFAYREYNMSIVGVRQSTLEGRTNIRTKLLACLLFACFETFHGNRDGAAVQIFAGVEAIDEYNALHDSATSSSLPPIDPEILRIFLALEIQAATHRDRRSNSHHLQSLYRGRAAAKDMPIEFKTLKEARLPLTRIVMRGIHLACSQRTINNFTHPSIIDLWWVAERANPGPNHTISTVDPIYALQCTILSEYKAWDASFSPLWRASAHTPDFHGAALLRMHSLSGFLCLASTAPHPDYYHRRYTAELKELVALARRLLESPHESMRGGAYGLEIGIVMPLTVVGWKYRHRGLRREVCELFRDMPRREGIWDAVVTGRIMEWTQEVEEEGMRLAGLGGDEEYVPEDMVATVVKLETDLLGRSSEVACVVKGGVGGGVTYRETVICW